MEKDLQLQIDDINRKLDYIIEGMIAQKAQQEEITDLVADVSLIGKDLVNSTIHDLDKSGVELDGDALKKMVYQLIYNIPNFKQLLDTLESFSDLAKDLTPIVNQVGLDVIHKVAEFEQKGYIDFIKESTKILDNVVEHFDKEDVQQLADNIVVILETVKRITQPDMLKAIDNAIRVFNSMNVQDAPEMGVFGAMKELRTKEMKKGIGFMITFLKNLSKEKNN